MSAPLCCWYCYKRATFEVSTPDGLLLVGLCDDCYDRDAQFQPPLVRERIVTPGEEASDMDRHADDPPPAWDVKE